MSKIFLIDNDIHLSRLYERMFRLEHHDIETAQDPLSALERLDEMETPPDVILMDVSMPNMTGLELFQELRSRTKTKNIPVVVQTNSIKKEEAQKFIELGAETYLMKMEQHPQDVVKKVEAIISAKK